MNPNNLGEKSLSLSQGRLCLLESSGCSIGLRQVVKMAPVPEPFPPSHHLPLLKYPNTIQ